MMRGMFLLLMLGCSMVEGQQNFPSVPVEPVNIAKVKKDLVRYHECAEADCYLPQMVRQSKIAIQFLKQAVEKAKPGDKLAIVLDIDETALSNWPVMAHDDFTYVAGDWNLCVTFWCGRALAPTIDLYNEAITDKVAVFFITGRPEAQRTDTEINLRLEGYKKWEGVYLRPEDHPKNQTVSEYKSGDRAIIAKKYRIVLNVGDQDSDLAGLPQAEHSVKWPNPFYYIP